MGDLHIGFETELEKKGYFIPSQTKNMLSKIKKLKKKSKEIILLGDVKHSIPSASIQEAIEIPFFLRKLKEIFNEVIIIKGNHDGNIERMTRIPVAKEFAADNIGFIHGHAKPSKDFMNRIDVLVMSHMHPVFEYNDSFGKRHSKKCWIIGKWRDKKVIIMPAFNEFFSGSNELIGPFAKEFIREEIFLTNLTRIL